MTAQPAAGGMLCQVAERRSSNGVFGAFGPFLLSARFHGLEEKRMRIRLLTPEDALSFRELRFRALRDHPDAFGSSYEEAANLSVEETAERLKSSPDALILGAFDAAGKLVGMVGFYREKGVKKRHKGVIWGMYCLPECRGKGVGKALLAEAVGRGGGMKRPGAERVPRRDFQSHCAKNLAFVHGITVMHQATRYR